MGRGKIEIKKIENVNSRQVTFAKRRSGLLKKAHELGVLCDAELAVIIFSNTGKLYQFSNHDMKRTLSRYNGLVDSSDPTMVESKEEEPKEVDILREEIEKLKVQQLHLLGKDLSDLGLKELQLLEQQLIGGLFSVKERKERLLIEQIEHSRQQEQRVMLENVTLRKQVQQLSKFSPLAQCSVPPLSQSYSLQGNNSIVKHDALSADTNCNMTTENGNSDSWLKLGFSSQVCQKRKIPETHSESENQEGTL